MNKEDIIRMAREAGATPYTNRHYPDRPTHTFNVEQLERFFQLATEWEREQCAKVCEFEAGEGPDNGCCPTYWNEAQEAHEAYKKEKNNG